MNGPRQTKRFTHQTCKLNDKLQTLALKYYIDVEKHLIINHYAVTILVFNESSMTIFRGINSKTSPQTITLSPT